MTVIADLLTLERAVYRRCAPGQPPSVLQLANRRKRARLGTGLVAAVALPPHIGGFTLQVLELAHVWSDRGDSDIDLSDILALAAAVHMFMKLNPPHASRTAHSDWSTSHQARPMTFQFCTRRGPSSRLPAPSSIFWKFWALSLQPARTPAAWVQILTRRLSLPQQQQSPQPPHPLAVPSAAVSGCGHQLAVAHVQSFPTASQVGATAWFVSAVLWIRLCIFAAH